MDTLEPFGPGSLGEALAPTSCEPRIVVFRVSGVIEVPGKHDLELRCGDVTIAGQTAPGAGITVHGRIDAYGADPAGNIVIRHLRLRPPPLTDEEGAVDDLGSIYDSLQLSNNSRVILDHVSLSWASDEVLDLFENTSDVTVQWSTIEASNPRGQPEGPHNYGLIAGPDSPRASFVDAWSRGDRDTASTIAGPEVVDAAFAVDPGTDAPAPEECYNVGTDQFDCNFSTQEGLLLVRVELLDGDYRVTEFGFP